jgi:hypothetical protein
MRKKKEKHETPVYSKYNDKQNRKSKSQHSVLKKHEQKIAEYKKKQNMLQQITKEIKTLEAINTPDPKYAMAQKRLKDLHEKCKDYNCEEEEVNYLLESSFIIMELSLIEQKEAEILSKESIDEDEMHNISTQKSNLIDEYLTKFEPAYIPNENKLLQKTHYCNECKEYLLFERGYLVCNSCGLCKYDMDIEGELSYKELQDYDYRPQFTYDKKSHLEDWLRRFTAKENKTIPQNVLDNVILEASKERIRDLNLLTEEKVKKYLKKLNLNDYYDNVISIINRINNRPPFQLTSEVENKIKFMFQQIQEPYEKHKPSSRKNFLSYSYVLHKIFQILGLHEFAKYFPLLKSADKLRQQDEIFKKIVMEMAEKDKSTKWVFYPSM